MQKQEAVDYIEKKSGISHAQASKIVGISRTKKYYKKKMPQKDFELKSIISEFIGSSRKGRKKITVLIKKKHPHISASKIRRVYEQQGFSLSKRPKRRIKNNPVNPISIPMKTNEEWAIDFMSDSLIDGRRLRTLNVVDHFNRACLGIEISFNLPAARVTNVLAMIIDQYGKPKKIRTDNGPEFRSKAFQLWLKDNNIEWSPIQNGKPQQNAIVERFNKTYREDVLDANLFASITEAQQITDKWLIEYNTIRPHQSLDYKAPWEYAA